MQGVLDWKSQHYELRRSSRLKLLREEPPAWRVPYTRELSPGRLQRVRIDRRCVEKPQAVLESDEGVAYGRLLEAGFARQWPGVVGHVFLRILFERPPQVLQVS